MKKITCIIIALIIISNLCSCNTPKEQKQTATINNEITNTKTTKKLISNPETNTSLETLPQEKDVISQNESLRPLQELEDEIITLLNKEREEAGLKPLKSENTLYDYVLIRARECEEYWSHTRPTGEKWNTVYLNNTKIEKIKIIAENLGRNFSTAKAIVNALMNSQSHRKNILNPDFTHICVAIIKMKPNEREPTQTLYAMAQHFYFKEEL